MVKLTPIFVLVVVLFVCYTVYLFVNRTSSCLLEAMDNPPACLDPVADEDTPSCQDSSGSNSSVPGCYNTVRGDTYNGFMNDFLTSDYILKTQMVTPVCPNNPVGEVGTEYGKEDRIVTPEDDLTKKDAAKTDYEPADVKPDVSKTPSFLSGDLFGSAQGTASTPTPAQSQPTADVKNTYLLNAPTTTVKPEPSRGSCPPCPSCQRCPEPVVECKRVVNYNAAGVSNLPVPMIADFSKF